MKEFKLDTTLNPMEQELSVLAYIRDNLPKSNKKMINMSRYLRKILPVHFIKSICDTLEDPRTANPLKWMQACINEMEEYPKIVRRLIEEGNHGMIMDGGNMYGFNLNTNPKWLSGKDTERWTKEDEQEIGNAAVKEWMIKNRRRHFDDKYLLFDEFGFSGIANKGGWTIPEDEWLNKIKPLRDAERRHSKQVAEIARYF